MENEMENENILKIGFRIFPVLLLLLLFPVRQKRTSNGFSITT